MTLVYLIEDDPTMANVLSISIRQAGQLQPDGTIAAPRVDIFHDAVSAIEAVNERVPDVILLDILLTGPDGFTFLNELISYQDTARIPVVLISSLDFSNRNLSHYGVVQVLQKSTMTPEDIQLAVINALASDPQTPSAPSPVFDASPPSNIAALNQKLAAASETPTPDEPADA